MLSGWCQYLSWTNKIVWNSSPNGLVIQVIGLLFEGLILFLLGLSLLTLFFWDLRGNFGCSSCKLFCEGKCVVIKISSPCCWLLFYKDDHLIQSWNDEQDWVDEEDDEKVEEEKESCIWADRIPSSWILWISCQLKSWKYFFTGKCTTLIVDHLWLVPLVHIVMICYDWLLLWSVWVKTDIWSWSN